jgi:hypothetical protein
MHVRMPLPMHARSIWGKVFERASFVKGSFDAASLTAFLWAASTAGVDHFKTVSACMHKSCAGDGLHVGWITPAPAHARAKHVWMHAWWPHGAKLTP